MNHTPTVGDTVSTGRKPSALNATTTSRQSAPESTVGQAQQIALLCSARCPGDLILKAYDFAVQACAAGVTIISGFHSAVERDCLSLLLKGKQKVILCLARDATGWRVPAHLRRAVAEGRIEIRSGCTGERRVTAKTAVLRNEYVAQIADQVLVVYATPGGKLEALTHRLIANGKLVLTFDAPYNENLIAHGARPLETRDGLDMSQRKG
ncbi:MAG TPA: hypothetical protein VK009_28600 [Chloroflexota bacterium]|nr:hypothetical protein [Chloroflexota bacterium]